MPLFTLSFTSCSSFSVPPIPLSRMCVSECPSGFFRDDRKRCKKCSSLCETCVGSRSDQCTTCRTGFHLNEGFNTCVASCGDGFYLDLGKFPAGPTGSTMYTPSQLVNAHLMAHHAAQKIFPKLLSHLSLFPFGDLISGLLFSLHLFSCSS